MVHKRFDRVLLLIAPGMANVEAKQTVFQV